MCFSQLMSVIVVVSVSQQLMTQGAGLHRMLCGCTRVPKKKERRDRRKKHWKRGGKCRTERQKRRGIHREGCNVASSARQSWQTLPSLHPPLLSNQTPRIRQRLQQAGRTKHWEEQSGLRGRRGYINAFLRENRVVRFHSNLLVALRGGTGYQHGFISFISDH